MAGDRKRFSAALQETANCESMQYAVQTLLGM
jgi:hypothetical protein